MYHGRSTGRKAGCIMGEGHVGKLGASWEKHRWESWMYHGRNMDGKAGCIMGEAQTGKLGAFIIASISDHESITFKKIKTS